MKSAVLALVLGTASTSVAAPGDHIRSGNLTITPRLGVGLQYRSNAFRSESGKMGTGVASITPGVAAAIDTSDVKFQLGADYSIQKYMFLSGGDTARRAERIAALDRFNNIGVDAILNALPTGTVGFDASYQLALRNNPSDAVIDSDDPYTTQFRNGAKAALAIRPGPALTISPGVSYTWTQFFVPINDAERDPFNSRNSYGPFLNAKWSFLPRTNFVFYSSYTLNRWSEQNPQINGADIVINDSGLGRVSAGVQGRVTERLRLIAKVGSGFGKFSDSTALGATAGLLAAFQATYQVSDDHSINAGFRKSFFDSFFTNSVSAISLSAGWNGQYGEKLSSSLTIGTRFESYDGPISRNDQVTQLGLGLGYSINSWSQVKLRGGWLQRSSEVATAEYDDINANLGFIFVY